MEGQTYTPKRGEIVVAEAIPECNFCADGTPGPYDFATVYGPWANGCEAHWRQNRAAEGLGVGKAQLWITADQVTPDPLDTGPMTVGAVLRHKRERGS